MVNKLKQNRAPGRVRLTVLALIVIVLGLVMQEWWWQIGLYMLVTIFVFAFLRYRGQYR